MCRAGTSVIADDVVAKGGDRKERDVLGQLHGRVLRADEADLEHAEAAGHEHDEHAADKEQKRVENEYAVLRHFLCQGGRCQQRATGGDCQN